MYPSLYTRDSNRGKKNAGRRNAAIHRAFETANLCGNRYDRDEFRKAYGRSGGSELLRGHAQMGTYEVTVKRELRDHLEFS